MRFFHPGSANLRLLNSKSLPAENVLLHADVHSADELFALVASHLAGSNAMLCTRIRERLKRRHLWRSVDLGNGFALPHAAVPALTTLRGVYVRSATAFEMGTQGGAAVRDSVTLLIPSPGLTAEHDLLMALTQSLLTPCIASALRSASSEVEVQRLLADCSGR